MYHDKVQMYLRATQILFSVSLVNVHVHVPKVIAGVHE